VLARPSPVPSRPGVYGRYFKEPPWPIDTSQCMTWDGCTLLYGGIAPKAPPANGRPADSSNADPLPLHRQRRRLDPAAHLGCLLAERLGIQLRRVGGGRRLTFAAGEARLSAWMADHAYVTWVETDRPWSAEQRLIASVNLPLNLDQNRHHAFISS
jgi:hypothetical protein